MKLPKLPVECIRRVLSGIHTHGPGRLSPDTLVAGLLFGEFDTDTYSPEELLKLNVLKPIIQGAAYVYLKSGFDEELIQFFDSIKNSLPSVMYFVRGIYMADDRPLDESKVKQHILDTLIGTAWRDPNFYIWGRPEISLQSRASTLSYDIKEMITKYFKAKYKRDPSIGGLLSEGLCIFDELPKDRVVKFLDALRRLMPYIRYLHMPTEYRQQYKFLVDDKLTEDLYKYDPADFPITFSAEDVPEWVMYVTWTIKDKKLVINKTFWLGIYSEAENKIMKKLYDKYPEQAKAITIERDDDDDDMCDIEWVKTELYEVPEDLQELGEIWQELL